MFYFYSPAYFSFGQCTATPPTGAACSGGNGALTSGANINSGNTYWYSASSGSVSNINLNGGTLRVCGTLTITNINFNSGYLIVESGGSLTIGSGMNMNGNSFIVNRGSLTVNGSVTLQNSNNTMWNLSSTSTITINGTLTVNSSSSVVINSGNITVTSLVIQNSATALCMLDFSSVTAGSFTNNTLNSVVYSGAGSPACLGVTSTAQLNSNVTSSNKIYVCLAVGATKTGSANWGSAVVTTNCSACNIALPLNIINFNAVDQGNKIKLSWVSENLIGNEIFDVQESDDGINFHSIALINAAQNQSAYTAYDNNISNIIQYYRIKETQYGKNIYSNIQLVKTGFEQNLIIYPNPVRTDNAINILFNSAKAENAILTLIDISGKLLQVKSSSLITGKNQLQWDFKNIPPGIYILKIQTASQGNFYSRVSVVNVAE